MPPISLPIHAGWKPDLSLDDIAKVGGLRTANNIVRTRKYYWPVPGVIVYNSNAMEGTPQVGVVAQASNGENYNFAFTNSALYAFNSSTLQNITNDTFTGSGLRWSTAVYGDWLVATNFVDPIQVLKGIAVGISGTKFINLGGSPVKARYLLMSHGHLILANLDAGGGNTYPKKLTWSARENIEQYTASVTTGADSQECPEIDGVITGLAGISEAFAIFSESSISVGSYIGGQYTFSIKYNVVRNIGCAYPGTLISIGGICFFWSKKSIWMFDGNSVTEVGADVKDALFKTLNTSAANTITSAHDSKNSIIYWAYPSGSSTFPDKVLAYNYSENVMTTLDLQTYFMMMAVSGGQLSDEISDLSDTITMQSDSPFYAANNTQLMSCNSDKKMGAFSGSITTATIETGEINQDDIVLSANRMYIPLEGTTSSGTAYIKHRYSLSETQQLSAGRPIRADRFVDIRKTDRRLSCYATLSNFDKLGNEIKIFASNSGGR